MSTQSEAQSRAMKGNQRNLKHGMRHTKEYRAWGAMKTRALNPNTNCWKNYGGRGITVHPEWIKSFTAFFAHVGFAPSEKHTIDRIENDKGYEPGNVRWATRTEQLLNCRRTVITAAVVEKIRPLRAAGLSARKISKLLGLGIGPVADVIYERKSKRPHPFAIVKELAKP